MYTPKFTKRQLRDFGKAFMLKRIEASLSIEDLADRASVNALTIRRIEKGQNITLVTLYKVASALEVSPCDILRV